MSITCPHCGRNIESDEEIQDELLATLPNIVVAQKDTLEAIRQEIQMLNAMVTDGMPHTSNSEELTKIALNMLDTILDE